MESMLSDVATSKPGGIGTVLEGQQVLQDLDNVVLAVDMLLGVIYEPELPCKSEVLF